MTVGKAMRFQMPTKRGSQMGNCTGGGEGGSGACGGLGGSPGGEGQWAGGGDGSCDVMWLAPTKRTRPQSRTTEMRMSQVGPYDEELALIEEEQGDFFLSCRFRG